MVLLYLILNNAFQIIFDVFYFVKFSRVDISVVSYTLLNETYSPRHFCIHYKTLVSLIFFFFFCQLNVRKCNECGQPLPESFEFPAVEPWSTGIFGCTEDKDSCKFTYLHYIANIKFMIKSLFLCHLHLSFHA